VIGFILALAAFIALCRWAERSAWERNAEDTRNIEAALVARQMENLP
jgi:hypothetical protein